MSSISPFLPVVVIPAHFEVINKEGREPDIRCGLIQGLRCGQTDLFVHLQHFHLTREYRKRKIAKCSIFRSVSQKETHAALQHKFTFLVDITS
jgi:hypothetical protein